ncbi:ABC transporter permease subunit [Evansella cellulosilytica]|uniref:Binding-protein-dependent transport systems inner membrane component n=1 Tax=Evansella cellulosilytica (strain ATCC 21833 / DSM 2522 / FERM P-1141 / JCM 9156 / N-4) TaxID=649639 RepID=E6TW68_EVAC2|nr:ABC transporter permease subunit [Evansella cellulosilytica]ADU31024.1 binding-protein-dependent transport systems inner membrane component [Evansella cellulosilytica DSM 2522]
MKILTKQFFILLIYLLLFISIILLALLPRGVYFDVFEYHIERSYYMDWTIYFDNIKTFFSGVLHGDLGTTLYGTSVVHDVSIYFFQRSLPIMLGAFLLALIIGVLLGVILYFTQNKRTKYIAYPIVWGIQSLPDFFIYIVIQVGLFHLFQWGLPTFSVYSFDHWYSIPLAVFIVALYPSAYLAMIVVTSLDSEAKKKYVDTARSKGVSPIIILLKHQGMNIANKVSQHIHSIMIMIMGNLLLFEYLFYMRGAAYRLYLAMGFHNADIRGSYRSMVSDHMFEPELIISLLGCFILVSYIVHCLQSLITSYLDRRGI